MKILKKFLWIFISSLLFADSINISKDRNIYNRGDNVNIRLQVNANKKFKIRFQAFDKNYNIMSPDFSSTSIDKVIYKIPSKYNYNYLTIKAEIIEDNKVIDNKSLKIQIASNFNCYSNKEVVNGDDNYVKIQLPFKFRGYTVMYPNTNGYITFKSGRTNYSNYCGAYSPMIWTSCNDLMTHVYVSACYDKVVIKWSGGYYPNWHGKFNSRVILYPDGSIYQLSGSNNF